MPIIFIWESSQRGGTSQNWAISKLWGILQHKQCKNTSPCQISGWAMDITPLQRIRVSDLLNFMIQKNWNYKLLLHLTDDGLLWRDGPQVCPNEAEPFPSMKGRAEHAHPLVVPMVLGRPATSSHAEARSSKCIQTLCVDRIGVLSPLSKFMWTTSRYPIVTRKW